jgi:hypothetical protein
MDAASWIALRRSEDPSEYERAAGAELPLATWERVLELDPTMAFWVAHAKKVPVEMLSELANDADPKVRGMVARKRKAPADLLRRLARDADSGVRAAVARNPRCPADVLSLLRRDAEPVVREAAGTSR